MKKWIGALSLLVPITAYAQAPTEEIQHLMMISVLAQRAANALAEVERLKAEAAARHDKEEPKPPPN